MCMNYLFLLFGFLAFASLNDAQDQSGFISIDCGIPDESRYTDETTGINYDSDVDYIDTGVSKSISTLYKTNGLEQQFYNVRSFLEGTKNCYTLTPPQILNHTRYFVRARFMYGNYDDKNEAPKFDIYLGVDYWATVDSVNQTTIVSKEALYVPSSDYTYVCLVNTGNGTPFISVLELRLVENSMYKSPSGSSSSFELQGRYDMRSYDNTAIIRFKDDIIDRIWEPPFFLDNIIELNTSQNIIQNSYSLPSAVMRTAITMQKANQSLAFSFQSSDPNTQYYFCMHFADFQSSQIREFNITLNDNIWYGPLKTVGLSTTTIYSTRTLTEATWFNFSLHKTFNSELPPILNALEIYTAKDFLKPLTNQQDVAVIKSIKSEYRIKSNWQGDPCAPANYSWLGLSCFYDRTNIPRINSLNLSFNGLSGTISPSIVNLSMMQSLDLSNNNLNGEVPWFLTQMQKLSILNLSGNNLSGTIPKELAEKARSGSLSLSFEGNPYLCTSNSCNTTNPVKNKESSMAVPIIASIAAVFVLIIALAIILFCILKRRKSQPKHGGATAEIVTRDVPFQAKQQQFTYSEVIKITRNFERVIGKGGFGSVFHGYIDNNQVAVKMLSPSSAQGYKQFKAEAELLMRVHHRNLTTFIGYCYEGDKLGLIYEYMANGDLETQLSDSNRKALSWYLRLQIVLDAAQGLEYLHTGCKLPIIHRDVKTTNILLNEEWQAKLADFGLSRAFPTEGGTHVSTAFAGTPGYLDPEYNLNEKTDVFSFGVVLLEIITGKPPISKAQERTHISKWVADTLEKKGDVRDVVDPRLGNEFDLNSVWKAVDVAMECVSPSSIQRPSMNHVVMDLRMCLEMEKSKMNKANQSEYDNVPETEYISNLDIGITDATPMAR